MKTITIVTPCYNEQENITELYKRVTAAILPYTNYNFEFLFIDNASTDKTVEFLKELAAKDARIKVIVNVRDFGHIRSPYWGIIQSCGQATIYLASDLQDPPELIPQFIEAWESGFKIALGIKPYSQTNGLTHAVRRFYYKLLDKVSDVPQIRDATGFGIYDKVVLDMIRKINDPYPYFRGLISELGYTVKQIPFIQARRVSGISKNNFYSLYDIGMLGIISHSLVPIRVASFFGFMVGIVSIFAALIFLCLKIVYWHDFPVGYAPIMISMFFMFGLLMCFIGLLGEYIGSIHRYLQKRPIVVEKERINF
jgi:dolichol-phosphate mannosyltransferase